MNNTLKILISTIILVLLGIYIETANASEETEPPIAIIEIVEEEIEIEYVNPDIWSQWVFDTDSGFEYIILADTEQRNKIKFE